jgi:hypothetical protein
MSSLHDAYRPNPEELRLGSEAYIRYLGGVSVIHNPYETPELHNLDPRHEGELLVRDGVQRMLDGIRGVISYANPPAPRGGRQGLNRLQSSSHYIRALPFMLEMADVAYAEHGDRIRDLSRALSSLRPMAMIDRDVYGKVCKGQFDHLHIDQLLDRVAPARHLREFTEMDVQYTLQAVIV